VLIHILYEQTIHINELIIHLTNEVTIHIMKKKNQFFRRGFMKKKLFSAVCTVITVIIIGTLLLAGCTDIGGSGGGTEPQEYTIQYTDNSGAHTLTVADGASYSLDVVPEKVGHEFLGLYDAEVGGTQYVSASGSSLAPFTDKKNMVLFPQFKAKDYTVILDYQGAAVTGSRQLTVTYGNSLPELPKNLNGEHKEFAGWYTQTECGGTKVADQYGLIPLVSVLNEQNFDLSGTSVTLYAGFEAEKHIVTFCFEEGMDTEEMEVAYDTPISKVVPKTRVNGNAVLTWSKTKGGEVWNGKVTEDIVLYAVEYAPVIEFDTDGGKEVTPVVARAGATIILPTPTKELAKFAYWEDMSGNKYTSTTMPSNSTSLKAIWQAKLVFDSNGGSKVDDISVAAGNAVTLPKPEKAGFIFAGWYTADREQYTSTTMPAAGVKLKAGWYKTKSVKKDFISGDRGCRTVGYKTPRLTPDFDIDFTELISELDWTKPINVGIVFHADFRHYTDNGGGFPLYYTKEHFYYYSQPIVNSAYLIDHIIVDHGNGAINENLVTCTFSMQATVTGGKIYAALGADKDCFRKSYQAADNYYYCGWDMFNFWAEISYPDTTNLYL